LSDIVWKSLGFLLQSGSSGKSFCFSLSRSWVCFSLSSLCVFKGLFHDLDLSLQLTNLLSEVSIILILAQFHIQKSKLLFLLGDLVLNTHTSSLYLGGPSLSDAIRFRVSCVFSFFGSSFGGFFCLLSFGDFPLCFLQ
jgi:hypothetical protein